jgi:hypothetical protein
MATYTKPATADNTNLDDTLVTKRDKEALFTVIEKGKHIILQALYPVQDNISLTPNQFDEAGYFHYDEMGSAEAFTIY